MTSFVLVHGAWHGAWCWERIIPALEAAGHRVVAVDLPGHGADRRPFGDLHADADSVRAALDGIDEPVVLVGHSYGGAVITDAGDHPAVAHLAYVAAFVLDDGETLAAAAVDEANASGVTPGAPGLAEVMRFADDGTTLIPAESVGELLYNCCDDDTKAWAAARVGPHPAATFTQPPRTIAWRATPATYVVCEQDRGIDPRLQRIFASRCTELVALDTDHSPFASTPDDLVAILLRLAESVA